MKPDLTASNFWSNRAMWSAFLEAHTQRRLAASTPPDEPAVPADRAGRPRAGARRGKPMHRARADASNGAGR